MIKRRDDHPHKRLGAFVATMPLAYDTPEYFDEHLIDLMPDYLRHTMRARVDKLRAKFARLSGLLESFATSGRHCEQNNKAIDVIRRHFSWDALRWAFCSTNSRCFHMSEADLCPNGERIEQIERLFAASNPKPLALMSSYEERKEAQDEVRNSLCCLIPLVDFLNHSFEANANGYYDASTRRFVLKAVELDDEDESLDKNEIVIDKGSQVYITYGLHDNATLLVEYGFVLDDNVYDKIEMRKSDFAVCFNNDNALLDAFWQRATEESQLVSDLTCNGSEGPSWLLLKLIDLAIDFAAKRGEADDVHTWLESYEMNNEPEKLGRAFLSMMSLYEAPLKRSLHELDSYANEAHFNFAYQKAIAIKLLHFHLDIVQLNLSLVNDTQRWASLF